MIQAPLPHLNMNQLASFNIDNSGIFPILPEDTFSKVSRALIRLIIGAIQLQNISQGLFYNMTNLETLAIGWNPFASIPDGTFRDLTSLTSLDLSGASSLSVTAAPLAPLAGSLSFLGLSNCSLNRIPAVAISQLKHLTNLDVSNDQISLQLNTTLPFHSPNLMVLDLTNSGLTMLPPNSFLGLNSLLALQLDFNDGLKLMNNSFNGLFALETLSLSNCNIQSLQHVGAFDQVSKTLQTLDPSRKHVGEFTNNAHKADSNRRGKFEFFRYQSQYVDKHH
eukprot:m.204935 g.204935  ORF g.204935 m.204935 type:complete len:279 (+) comp15781_c0_seq1:456-1292(+)